MANNKLIFGEIENVDSGDIFDSRKELNKAGVHGPTMGGIWGRENEGACSIVLSGGYEDDIDNLDYILYTGHGGQDSPGGKQVSDQVFRRGNLGLKVSCDMGYPVRVTRGFQIEHGPYRGYRYDGLYEVSSYERIKGKNGFFVCRFHLNRLENQKKITKKLTQRTQPSERLLKSVRIEGLEELFKSNVESWEDILFELNYRNSDRSKRLATNIKLKRSFNKSTSEKIIVEPDIEKKDIKHIEMHILEIGITEKKLSDIKLSARTFNALSSANIISLGELVEWSPNKLKDLPNLGKKSFIEIEELLELLLTFKSEEDFRKYLRKNINLSERDQIIADQYNQGLTLEAIGAGFDISRERIRQILNSVKRKGAKVISTSENSKIRSGKISKERADKFGEEISMLYNKNLSYREIGEKIGEKTSLVQGIVSYLLEEGLLNRRLYTPVISKEKEALQKERFEIILSMKNEGKTLTEIGRILGISNPAVSSSVAIMRSKGIYVPALGPATNRTYDVDLEQRYYRTKVILEMTAEGKNKKEIGKALGMGQHGIHRHIRLYITNT